MLLVVYKKGTKKVLYRYLNLRKFEVKNEILHVFPLDCARIKLPLEEVDFVCLV